VSVGSYICDEGHCFFPSINLSISKAGLECNTDIKTFSFQVQKGKGKRCAIREDGLEVVWFSLCFSGLEGSIEY
jgi:hypothetical protein